MFSKDEIVDVLSKRDFRLLEDNVNAGVHFSLVFSSPTGMNHLVILTRKKGDNKNLIVYLQDHNRVSMVVDSHPFRPKQMACTEFPRMADFELFLDVVRAGVYVPKTRKAPALFGANY